MKTDDLIRALAADGMAARPLGRALALGLFPALALAVLALWLVLGFRADLGEAIVTPVSAARWGLTSALALLAGAQALACARPGQTPRVWPVLAVAAVAAGLWLWAWLTIPAEGRQMALVGKTVWTCLVSIPLLSILPVAAVLAMMRHGAPTNLRLSGAIAGLAGGGAAAAVYALHCTEDSPLFYVTWYGTAILGVAAVSTLLGARVLRW